MKRIIIISILTATLLGCSKEKKSDLAAEKMQAFVSDISAYARNYDPGFIIIPQNGIELAYNNLEPGDGINTSYLSAIDGFGVEELFYNGPYTPDNERIAMLQRLKDYKKILVSEYISDSDNIPDALSRNYTEGFLCFPRISSNYHYHLIPDSVPHPNAFNITNLPDAQNYLYLISTDSFASKQVMIDEISATDFDIVLIDLFFNETEFTSSEINLLKRKANGAQRLVISYVNIGSAENFRYYWKPDWELHHPHWLKKKYEGYDDEIWVEFWEKEWQDIIFGNDHSYLKKILDAGFDGAYLDNVEAYYLLYFCH